MCHTFLFRCWWARFFRMMRDGQHWWVQPPYALTTVAVIWTSLSSPFPSSLPNFMQSPVLLHIQRRPSTYIDIDSCLWRRICVHFNCNYGQVILTVPSGSGKTNTVCVAAFKLCCLSEGLATQGICNCFFGGSFCLITRPDSSTFRHTRSRTTTCTCVRMNKKITEDG